MPLSNHHPRPHSPWKTVIHLFTHIVVGSALFLGIATAAWGLGLYVHFLEQNQAGPYVVFVLTGVEYALVTLDALCFLYMVGKSLYKAAKELEL